MAIDNLGDIVIENGERKMKVYVCVYECSNNDKRHGKVDDLNRKQHF